MQIPELATAIHAVRNTAAPSRILLPPDPRAAESSEPHGILLLKPSSGFFPLATIREILDRLVTRHGYRVLAAAWWQGEDLKANGMMARHYPGFHRMAHGGAGALSPEARARLQATYAPAAEPRLFASVFGAPFGLELVQTPYDLVKSGPSPERLNQLWEQDRTQEAAAIRRIQRLDEDTFALALPWPGTGAALPASSPRAVILLNGFYAKLEHDFETRGGVALWIQQTPASTTAWDTLRQEYAGSTNPFQAPAHTIRGAAARGLLQVETVSILANVIHLSANAAEGRREVEQVWWEPNRLAAVFGPPAAASSQTLAGPAQGVPAAAPPIA